MIVAAHGSCRRLAAEVDGALILRVLLVVIAYLSGSIPVGVLVARASGGPDPRSVGSGRTGGTNALRALGRKWAALVVAGDLAKGAGPVLLTRILTGGDPLAEVLVAAAAVVGSGRSIFLGFHGGRGVGTGVGTMLVIQPLAVILAAPVFFVVILVTRYVSLGSLLGSAAMFPAMLLIWAVAQGWVPPAYLVWAAVGPALIWIAHADNIQRLIQGTERKFDLGLLVGRRTGS
jgi:acyl phosphate:glycerol-3-phosphate acyltransferase